MTNISSFSGFGEWHYWYITTGCQYVNLCDENYVKMFPIWNISGSVSGNNLISTAADQTGGHKKCYTSHNVLEKRLAVGWRVISVEVRTNTGFSSVQSPSWGWLKRFVVGWSFNAPWSWTNPTGKYLQDTFNSLRLVKNINHKYCDCYKRIACSLFSILLVSVFKNK